MLCRMLHMRNISDCWIQWKSNVKVCCIFKCHIMTPIVVLHQFSICVFSYLALKLLALIQLLAMSRLRSSLNTMFYTYLLIFQQVQTISKQLNSGNMNTVTPRNDFAWYVSWIIALVVDISLEFDTIRNLVGVVSNIRPIFKLSPSSELLWTTGLTCWVIGTPAMWWHRFKINSYQHISSFEERNICVVRIYHILSLYKMKIIY